MLRGSRIHPLAFESRGDKRRASRAPLLRRPSLPIQPVLQVQTQLLVDRIRVFARPPALRSPCTVARWADRAIAPSDRSVEVPKFLIRSHRWRRILQVKIHALPAGVQDLTLLFSADRRRYFLQNLPARSDEMARSLERDPLRETHQCIRVRPGS